MRKSHSFIHEADFIEKALQHADTEQYVVYLNPNNYSYPNGPFQHILAFGGHALYNESKGTNFHSLQKFIDKHADWTFGYFSYDLKNETENLTSEKTDSLNFPAIHFFIPKHILFFKEGTVEIQTIHDPMDLYETIQKVSLTEPSPATKKIDIQQKINKPDYISKIKQLQQKILEGEVYEINFCMEYFAHDVFINPLALYKRLNELSPMPFSSYLKAGINYLMCASPERFLKKDNQKIIAQPIKGTARRSSNLIEDTLIIQSLRENEKERAENIMIVDLLRNDLSKSAIPGSVKVEELCKVYSFPKVHQMISTVVAEIAPVQRSVEVIKNSFPMGSMTGAPKVRSMELIEDFEESKRGLFSGSVGYFSPEQDFDFNVVIRSLLYNKQNSYLSYQVGSAITYYADAEKEYEECTLKVEAILETLSMH